MDLVSIVQVDIGMLVLQSVMVLQIWATALFVCIASIILCRAGNLDPDETNQSCINHTNQIGMPSIW